MIRPRTFLPTLAFTFNHRWRALLTFHLFFVVLGVAVLTPTIAFLMTTLLDATGHPSVSNEDLYRFALSPAGWLWAAVAGSLALTVVFVQHAGMLLVVEVHGRNRYQAATAALVAVLKRLPILLKLAMVQVTFHALMAAPFVLAIIGLGFWLLLDYDPYFLLSDWPRDLQLFIALSLPLLAGVAWFNGRLYLRWILALPILMFEHTSVRLALRRSHALTRHHHRAMGAAVVGVAVLSVLLPLALTLAFRFGGMPAVALLPPQPSVMLPAMVVVIALYLGLSLIVGFIMVSANALLIRHLYLRAHGVKRTQAPPPQSRMTGWLAWASETALVVFALGQGAWIMHSFFDVQDRVAITAHRGSSMNAPENTLTAIDLAIREGADYVEIDVQQTADGALVLFHDRDLRRIARRSDPITSLTLAELRQVDAGSWFSPNFAGERIPTLEEAIALVRGRAQLYLEIKPSPRTPGLTAAVMEQLQAEGMLADTVVAALDRRILAEVRRLAPSVRTTLFVHTEIGQPNYAGLHAVGLRAATVNDQAIRRARNDGHELHVWTVNDPTAMTRFIDLGVDNIITDRPDVLANLLAERAELNDAERMLLRLGTWLRD